MGSKAVSLTEGPITKSVIVFAVPVLLSGIFQWDGRFFPPHRH